MGFCTADPKRMKPLLFNATQRSKQQGRGMAEGSCLVLPEFCTNPQRGDQANVLRVENRSEAPTGSGNILFFMFSLKNKHRKQNHRTLV